MPGRRHKGYNVRIYVFPPMDWQADGVYNTYAGVQERVLLGNWFKTQKTETKNEGAMLTSRIGPVARPPGGFACVCQHIDEARRGESSPLRASFSVGECERTTSERPRVPLPRYAAR